VLGAVVVCLMALAARPAASQPAGQAGLERLLARDEITILVTDSGLGGLSVAAELEKSLREAKGYRRVTIVFANALPDVARTYNAMGTRREKVEAFDRALDGMVRWSSPDIVLVACNTLSVLLPDTRFVAAGRVPIVGIVAAGVDVIEACLKARPGSTALILGTPTTIEAGAHKQALQAQGMPAGRVAEQACPMLETEIQADPSSDVVRGLVEVYADQARTALGDRARGPLVVGLCCSHYGYSRAIFEEVFAAVFGPRVEIVDPNIEMCRSVTSRARRAAFAATETTVRVVSRAEISEGERTAIAAVLARTSSRTADALRSYERKLDLFNAQ
jgi:glutamate racemase